MNIYVSNLSFNVKDEDLKEFFTPYGEVTSAKVINDKFTGQSKGFGFVEMSSQSEAQKAISMFNGYSLKDRQLTVNVARPREERGGFRQQRGGKERRRY